MACLEFIGVAMVERKIIQRKNTMQSIRNLRMENTAENVSRAPKMKRRVAPLPRGHYAIYIDNSRGFKKYAARCSNQGCIDGCIWVLHRR
jgi:hypothetical protein